MTATCILFALLAGAIALILGFIFGAWFGSENVRRADERLIATLEADRDAARNEAKVFRGLLLPNFGRVDAMSRVREDYLPEYARTRFPEHSSQADALEQFLTQIFHGLFEGFQFRKVDQGHGAKIVLSPNFRLAVLLERT